jgi:hypothetical protein
MILFRPVGLKELELIAAAAWRAFPPRLFWQPIFYPVVTIEYARKIATEWNSNESEAGHVGFVTQFEIDDEFAKRYPVQLAGGRACPELWVPAEELTEFNEHLTGPIRVVESIYGPGWTGPIDPASKLPTHIAAMLPTELESSLQPIPRSRTKSVSSRNVVGGTPICSPMIRHTRDRIRSRESTSRRGASMKSRVTIACTKSRSV